MAKNTKLVLPSDAKFSVEYAREQIIKLKAKQDRIFGELLEVLHIEDDSKESHQLFSVVHDGLLIDDEISFTGKELIGSGE